jgi:hypothetical protein
MAKQRSKLNATLHLQSVSLGVIIGVYSLQLSSKRHDFMTCVKSIPIVIESTSLFETV